MPALLNQFSIVKPNVCVCIYICMELDSLAVLTLELFLIYTSCLNTSIVFKVILVSFSLGFVCLLGFFLNRS